MVPYPPPIPRVPGMSPSSSSSSRPSHVPHFHKFHNHHKQPCNKAEWLLRRLMGTLMKAISINTKYMIELQATGSPRMPTAVADNAELMSMLTLLENQFASDVVMQGQQQGTTPSTTPTIPPAPM